MMVIFVYQDGWSWLNIVSECVFEGISGCD